MVLTMVDITDSEKKRFIKYQQQGMLPSSAMRRIEAERRIGFEEEKKEFLTEDTMFKIGLGVIGLLIVIVYVKAKTTSPATKVMSIDKIEGIDLSALSVCREKGLM